MTAPNRGPTSGDRDEVATAAPPIPVDAHVEALLPVERQLHEPLERDRPRGLDLRDDLPGGLPGSPRSPICSAEFCGSHKQ